MKQKQGKTIENETTRQIMKKKDGDATLKEDCTEERWHIGMSSASYTQSLTDQGSNPGKGFDTHTLING